MHIQVLKSKLQEVIVTAANKEYEGSITIDEKLMEAANFQEYERVEVNAVDKPERHVTYVLKGERGSGCIEMNGGLAQYFQKGDHVHVLSYALVDENEKFKTKIVYTNKCNKVYDVK